MNKKNKTYSQFIVMVVILLLSSVGVGAVYKAARNRPPVVYDKLSPDVIARLNKLKLLHGGSLFTDAPIDPEKWDNKYDLGQNANDPWDKLEDSNFIIYYRNDVSGKWKNNAELTLKLANKSISDLARIFGKYIYPKDVNYRKLAIYLPPTSNGFEKTLEQMGHKPEGMSGVIGITLTLISPSGVYTDGIVIRSTTYDPSISYNNSYKVTVPHEMGHYVYMSLYDFNQEAHPLNWVVEGIAEHVASRSDQVKDAARIEFIDRNCSLVTDFPEETNSMYWAGESFFRFMSDSYGRQSVTDFIKNTYKMHASDALEQTFTGHDMKEEWVKALKKGAQADEMDVNMPDEDDALATNDDN